MQTPTKMPDKGRDTRSERKRRAILDAAADLFLQNGYLGTNMDQVAQQAEVSKQTVYKQFACKEALFIAIVKNMTTDAGNRVHAEQQSLDNIGDIGDYLRAYAERQLLVVLTPRLMQLRRLVIGEAGRFPELGQALYEGGPGRAIAALAAEFEQFVERGLLALEDAYAAATHFNWLVMGEPVNKAMLLGDAAIPNAAALRRHAGDAVSVFLAAYAPRATEPKATRAPRRPR